MSDTDEIPEADRLEGAPHPRHTDRLFGQDAAEAAFLDAYASGRLAHAWLLTGPRGVGKATLAWRIARFLAAQQQGQGQGGGLFGEAPAPATSLDLPPDHPVMRRAAQLAEPRIALCRRSWDPKAKRLKTQLTVDEVRALKSHFTLSATDGGWRAAIIDSADEMNTSAANAILKILEEPPEKTVLLMVSHQPAKLLPTIRSRCRVLRLPSLSEEDLARALAGAGQPLDAVALLHALTGGSVGTSVRFQEANGAALYPEILSLLVDAPGMDRQDLFRLAATATGRAGLASYEMITDLISLALGRIARAGAGHPDPLLEAEQPVARRLCPDAAAARDWADTLARITGRLTHARAVNLDPEQVILDMFLTIEKTAAGITRS
ncbi:DNA polymerase III subunit delta' [Oceanibium sediminis]|uniref:DNA polymerase III subunit delta' n=1 Tax=Oceanibium sediminis TaxID=2026339 RepID=UPI000DD4048D|nr:DNA polymerase III subunit delta' [Oceanibium sediminis]